MSSSCCPPDSFGYLAAGSAAKGAKCSAPGIEYYASRGERVVAGATDTKCIIIIPDVWGWDSGRTRLLADHWANELNCLAVVPKLQPPLEGGTDGDALPPNFDMSTRGADFKAWCSSEPNAWPALQVKLQALHDHLSAEMKVEQIALVGFCWGYWCVARMLGEPSLARNVACSAGAHPSVTLEDRFFGGSSVTVMQRVQVPTLLLPAKNDPDSYRGGGELFAALQSGGNVQSESHSYPDVVHGWVNRGDVSDPVVKENVTKAVGQISEWLKRFMSA